MEDLDSDDLAEQLDHEKKLLKILQRNQRYLLEEQAKVGGKATVEAMNQIEHHAEQIRIHRAEIKRLRSRRAEAQFSEGEATYRRVLAETLGGEQHQLRFISVARQEEMRVQLGIIEERAKSIEAEVQSTLAEEILMTMAPEMIRDLLGHNVSAQTDELLMQTLGRSIRLDPEIAAQLFCMALESSSSTDRSLYGLREALFEANPVWPNSHERSQFEAFLSFVSGRFPIQPYRPPQIAFHPGSIVRPKRRGLV